MTAPTPEPSFQETPEETFQATPDEASPDAHPAPDGASKRLLRELDALRRSRIVSRVEVKAGLGWRERTRLVVGVALETFTGDLEIVLPPTYPFTPPHVTMLSEHTFRRHVNFGVICLLGDGVDWDPTWTVADLLTQQLPKLLADQADDPNWDVNDGTPEPASVRHRLSSAITILIDSDVQLREPDAVATVRLLTGTNGDVNDVAYTGGVVGNVTHITYPSSGRTEPLGALGPYRLGGTVASMPVRHLDTPPPDDITAEELWTAITCRHPADPDTPQGTERAAAPTAPTAGAVHAEDAAAAPPASPADDAEQPSTAGDDEPAVVVRPATAADAVALTRLDDARRLGPDHDLAAAVFTQPGRFGRPPQRDWIGVWRHRHDTPPTTRYTKIRIIPGGVGDLLARARVPRRRRDATVVVVGVGGLGSQVALAVARAGIGELRLLDGDSVEPGALQRQLTTVTDIGRLKVFPTAELIADLTPTCRVLCTSEQIGGHLETPALLTQVLDDADCVIDCSATPSVTRALAQRLMPARTPLVVAAATHGAWGGTVTVAGAGGACWPCVELSRAERLLTAPPADPAGTIEPAGCQHATYAASHGDLMPLASWTAQTAVDVLDGAPVAPHAVMSTRTIDDRRSPPRWTLEPAPLRPDCPWHDHHALITVAPVELPDPADAADTLALF